jgi:hypothetical protein
MNKNELKGYGCTTETEYFAVILNNEYWIDSGQTCFQETKEAFYKAINAGFRGFILYPSGKTYWVK